MTAVTFKTKPMEKLNNFFDRYKTPVVFFTVFSAIFIRYLYFGLSYYYQLDDYIQYHNFATSNDYGALIIKEGLLAARPLAGIADLYVWSRFYDYMILGVLIISLMYACSALLLLSVFGRHFGTGMFFCAVYTLLPLGFEGTYWMSASSRIISGLFFASVAIYIFQKLCDTGRYRCLPVWMLAQLVSFCFYEQVLVFSFTLTFLIMYLNYRRRISLFGLLSLANAAIYFIFTGMFAGNGMLSARASFIFPTSQYYYKVFLPEISRQIGAAFIKGGLLTLFKGFVRGIRIIISDLNMIYIIIILILASLYFILAREKHKNEINNKSPVISAFIIGFIITIAPITPFLFLGNPWFSLRGTVCSFAGAALLADTMLRLLFKNKNIILKTVTSLFVLVCCISSVSELNDYKKTYEYDRLVTNIVLEEVRSRKDLGRVGILNLNASYLDDQNYYFHEHIHGVTENNWAFYGALVSIAKGQLYSDIVPLATDGFSYYAGWNREIKRIDNFDTLYFWNSEREKLLPLYVTKENESAYNIFYDDNTPCAYIWEEDGFGYIRLYQ